MSGTLSVHVLDAVSGRPAIALGVAVLVNDVVLIESATDKDGRSAMGDVPAGIATVRFDTGAWFTAQGRDTFYPQVEVCARITAGEHHHVALLLSPFAYSTYRGS
jgi:5-hydroxyisourate hydrolase